jgi:DNA mismatch repair protein MutS
MAFQSILIERTEDGKRKETPEAPGFFADLCLDQIIDAVTGGKEEYHLKPFSYTPLNDIDAILYRHEIMQDLEDGTLFKNITSFAQTMRAMRAHLVQVDKLHYTYQKQAWFLDAVEIYCDAVNDLARDLNLADLNSRGLYAFRDYLTNYAASEPFVSLSADTKQLKDNLSRVKYCVLIKDNTLKVHKYESEIDYSVQVERIFEKFKQKAAKDYAVKFPASPDMNHIEAKVLDFVAQLYPEIFQELDDYFTKHANYLDGTIRVFDREIQFYVTYLDYVSTFRRAGFQFCYPTVANKDKEVYAYEAFDLALAHKLVAANSPVVCNDFYLKGEERIFVVSGPNQGGKTTFARMFGQLHYLASLGCPVPGREARLFLFDRLFTHFEQEEDIKNLRGKLQDDLIRFQHILNHATPSSIIIMNEILTSTTLKDAVFLGKKVMQKIMALDALCVCVSFIDELAYLSEKTVSMVSMVDPENPALRTYKIVRRPADGLSYAMSIAEKYRLTYERLKERIRT